MADWQVDVFHTLVLHCPDRIHMHGLPPPGIQQIRLDKDMYQCVTVPKMLNDTDTDTFFRYQIFPIPVPIPPEKNENFPVPAPIRYRYPL